jgi:methyltransferase (TIGR00027 family)
VTSTLAAQQKASRTAYDCAAVRAAVHAATGLQSFDYLAADIVSSGSASLQARFCVALLKLGIHGPVRMLINRESPGSDIFMYARQAVPDDMIRKALLDRPETQTVILGAGLDTSGVRIGAERRAAGTATGRFFEVDLPAMQDEKRLLTARLRRMRQDIDDSHITYVPCSFGENEFTVGLRAAGFDPSKPSIWVWSGVVHYLTETAVRATLTEIKTLSAPGSELFFDFILLEAYERPAEFGFAQTKKRFDAYGEIMSFGFRRGPEHVRDWLAAQGIRFVRSYTNLDMVDLYERDTGKPASSKGPPWCNLVVAAL